ncbi:MAG TPA: hypothetical protein VKR58_09300 [Aquella sp.]|nr:hypothetical protein [Aquella sp.]
MLLKLLSTPGFFFAMLFLMLICLETGRRIRSLAFIKKNMMSSSGISNGPVETVIYALFGLLLAFTFTGAGTRFEARLHLITDEANAIGTAYLRIDFLPKEVQPQMRNLFKQYTLIRANAYKKINNEAYTKSMMDSTVNFQKQIWNMAVNNCEKQGASRDCSKLVMPSFNEMFDITTTREMAQQNHPPTIIYIMLILLSLFSAILVGYDLPRSNRRNLMYMLSYALIISLVLCVIIDLETPRYGFINVHNLDKIFLDMSQTM